VGAGAFWGSLNGQAQRCGVIFSMLGEPALPGDQASAAGSFPVGQRRARGSKRRHPPAAQVGEKRANGLGDQQIAGASLLHCVR
jgi:hypothetical protein